MRVDLHTHSLRSDGIVTPSEVARLGAAAGLGGVALTDHDTVDGWDECAAACQRAGLAFVPGLELSTEDVDQRSVHLLGYFVDPQDPALRAECARLRDERADRARRILARLTELGIDVDPELVARHAGGAPVGRPHVAAAMVDAGVVPDLPAAFDQYLADGGPAWVPKHALAPEDGVALIRGAGGVAVLAHPASTGPVAATTALVQRLATVGLAGLEAEHAGAGPVTAAYWRRVAAAEGLIVTGSSDFHGRQPDQGVGDGSTPWELVEELARRSRTPAAVGGGQQW